MVTLRNTFVEGELLMVTTGKHSDYIVHGVYRVLKNFIRKDSLSKWAYETNRFVGFDVVRFLYEDKAIEYHLWLVEKGYVKKLSVFEYHLASDPCHDIYLEDK